MPVTTSSHPKHPAVTNLNHSLVNNSSLNNSSVLNNSGLLNDSTLPILNSSVTEELELKEVKKSGTFLDGCKIHILGKYSFLISFDLDFRLTIFLILSSDWSMS